MNITVFTQLLRTYRPTTGVGRFINNMVLGLARERDMNLSLLMSRTYEDNEGKLDPRTPLGELPRRTYPLHERVMERMWKLIGMPGADRWVGNPDWLWLSAEAYLPVKRQKILLTNYDMNQAEPTMPWGDPEVRRRAIKRFRYWFEPSLAMSHHIITISEYSKKRLCELFDVKPEKVSVVSCGIEQPYFDIAKVDPAALPPRPCAEPYLLVIGGLNARKGGKATLEIAKSLARRKSEIQILIAGSNDDDLVKEAAALPNIKLLGFVPDAELPALLRHASGLLFLSLYEGFGIPAAEAMAVGTPAIVANTTSLPEVVGDAGFVVELEEAETTAVIAERLVSDEAFHADYVRRGHERAKLFTWDACVQRLASVLRKY